MKSEFLGTMKRPTVRSLTWMAALVALQIVLGKLSIGSDFLKVGLGFVASALLGYYFGAWWAAIASMVSDIIGSTLFATSSFFIGFTVSAMVAGFIYGAFLYQKPATWWRVIVAVLLVTIIVNAGLNTIWIHMMYHTPYSVLLGMRVVKDIIVAPIQIIVIYLVIKFANRYPLNFSK